MVFYSINMRIFKISIYFFLLISSLIVHSTNATKEKSNLDLIGTSENSTSHVDEKPQIGDHYDQRQNGTENYRIHVDGLVLVVAPIEGLLLAGGLPSVGDSGIFGTSPQENPIIEKPKPDETVSKPTAIPEEKPPSPKSSHRDGLRLLSLLSPFLRRIHPHQ